MTQEQEELLLRDLCARLPYNVKGLINGWEGIIYPHDIEDLQKDLRTIKPYLRPMSSMSDEEREEERKLWDIVTTTRNDLHYLYTDFLVSHHLDFRGLIPMGLALEAPEEMYNIK